MRKQFKGFKASVFFQVSGESQKRQRLLNQSRRCSHVLSCLAVFNDVYVNSVFERREIVVCHFDFPWAFLLDRALYVITFSVLDTRVIYLWPWV